MSPSMKISLLALVSTVAAVPQYGHGGGHSKFHKSMKPSGDAKPYPTGGWNGFNSTRVPQPTGTGAYGQDTTIDVTTTSTTTLFSTVVVKPSPVAGTVEAVVEHATTGVASQCGPATVTVTASEKVTVTVTPGGGADVPKSSASPAVPAGESSAAPVIPSAGNGYGAPSSSVKAPGVSSAAAAVSSAAAPAAPSSKAPVPSSAAPASSSKVELPSVAPVPSSAVVVSTKSAAYLAVTPPAQTPAASSAAAAVSSAAAAAASSAAPSAKPSTAPSSGNTYSGTKRGLAYNEAGLCKTLGSKFGFGYNWGQVENNDIGTEFIPLMHSPQKGTSKDWLANVDKAVKKGSKAVMGFNECDHAEQCNMSPEAACTAWSEYMNPIATAHPDVTIIGPSVTNGGAPMGLDWLQRFQKVCPGAVMHATNIHFYTQADDQTLTRFIKQIDDAYTLYGKPVWITEFGLNPGSAPEKAAEFLKGAMKHCDDSPKVQGYSYFMVGNGENYLSTGSALSAMYASM